jgi:hypothetical protein
MSSTKTIKGQAWIEGNKLVQEQILLTSTHANTLNTVVLIDDIWADLTSASGTYKVSPNNSRYFYWEYQMTDTEDDEHEVTVKFECPKPKEGLFTEPYDPNSVEGDYAIYWVTKMKEAVENYEYKAAVQKKEIIFPGTSYMSPDTNTIEQVQEIKVKNSDISDISNLLSLF